VRQSRLLFRSGRSNLNTRRFDREGEDSMNDTHWTFLGRSGTRAIGILAVFFRFSVTFAALVEQPQEAVSVLLSRTCTCVTRGVWD
jgi:hypothetical protein